MSQDMWDYAVLALQGMAWRNDRPDSQHATSGDRFKFTTHTHTTGNLVADWRDIIIILYCCAAKC